MSIEIYDFEASRWDPVAFSTMLSGTVPTLLYPVDWYTFFKSITLFEPGDGLEDLWLPQVLGNGDTSNAASRARLRVRNDISGVHRVLPVGYAQCTTAYETATEALAACGDPGKQYFSDVLAAGFDDSGYTPYPVFVKRHPSASINNELADLALHAASVVFQREDPNPMNLDRVGDYACPVTFQRSGSVTVLNTNEPMADPDGILSSGTERSWYLDQGESNAITVIVVKGIQSCGGSGNGGTLGCGFQTSNIVIVPETVGLPPTSERIRLGPLWAHEILHTFLGPWDHQDPALQSTDLKSNQALPVARRINGSDCNTILAGIVSP